MESLRDELRGYLKVVAGLKVERLTVKAEIKPMDLFMVSISSKDKTAANP